MESEGFGEEVYGIARARLRFTGEAGKLISIGDERREPR